MRCRHCSNPAELRYTEIDGSQSHSVPLCGSCAEALGVRPSPAKPTGAAPKLTVHARVAASPSDLRCPRCRTTLAAIRRNGRVGCADCYRTFRSQMGALLERVHGDTEHRGRRPGPRIQLSAPQPVLDALQVSEDFEGAARLRDRIARARRGAADDGPQP